ncbi:MAG: glycoside hydrolase family 3 C-terminal domain-containing protein [Eubacteriales bacterium]|nr:glycoside hydrolase family 3 C-terminal domain-containing protein [Eubacteriales bacterium]
MDISKVISEMTLEEKAGLCSGADFWHTKAVERLGVSDIMVSDGPHGLRKQDQSADHLGVNESIKAVGFPAASATACSFDRELVRREGEALGGECQHEGVAVLLGPAVNIKRSPLCGRNFEYFSEDPYLAGEMATGWINGVQSRNVGTSIKHFACNNQEHRRNTSDSVVDERTLREIYLTAFETAVKESQPWTVMCSYNQLNGVQVSENRRLLTEILRDEWGFEGFVVSDWGAVRDRVKGVEAGLDLEMPSSNGVNDKAIVEAVKSGALSEEVLDQTVARILRIVEKFVENRQPDTAWDQEADHRLSAQIASESAVLLKNSGILPLKKEQKVVFLGEFADKPRFQGGGSSHINCFRTESALEAAAADSLAVTFAQGYTTQSETPDEAMIAEAVEAAKAADAAVIFAGLPDSFESEGYDRDHMRMPENQNALIAAVAAVQPNTVVVLHHGSPMEMPWADDVAAILDMYLGGQAVGRAEVDLLWGAVNPSGRLAETIPFQCEDNPSSLYYGGEGDRTEYREGIFVGYRYYDKKKAAVRYPFGYGLSYTTFEYSDLSVDQTQLEAGGELKVCVKVTNTGAVAGKEVVQLYVRNPIRGDVIRPVRELRAFDKVELAPGETKEVCFTLSNRAFSYYNAQIGDWYAPSGEYAVEIGRSSREIVLEQSVSLHNARRLPVRYDDNTLVGDLMKDEKAAQVCQPLFAQYQQSSQLSGGDSETANEAISQEMVEKMFAYMPLRQLLSFGGGAFTREMLDQMIAKLNEIAEQE